MGIEYYLVKPEKKELFYLGKHFNGFSEIRSTTYFESLDKANYPTYEDWEDFLWDVLRTNWYYFLDCDLTLEQTFDVIHQIYEWCVSDKVILDNDCSNTCETWKEWKETGDITTILEVIHNPPKLDTTAFINDLLEENESLLFENPSYKSSLIGITTDGRAVYDYSSMVNELVEKENMDYEEAVEFIDYNTLGVLPSSDTKYPIVIQERNI